MDEMKANSWSNVSIEDCDAAYKLVEKWMNNGNHRRLRKVPVIKYSYQLDSRIFVKPMSRLNNPYDIGTKSEMYKIIWPSTSPYFINARNAFAAPVQLSGGGAVHIPIFTTITTPAVRLQSLVIL